MRRRTVAPRVVAVLLVALLGPSLAACTKGDSAAQCQSPISEPINPALNHVLRGAIEPTYATDPPTSGPHTPGATPTGALAAPLSRPDQIGALEAGVVLLQYRDLTTAETQELSSLVTDRVVVAPNPNLPDRVVATAWLAKQTCSGVDGAQLRGFVRTHVGRGPGTDG